MRIHNKGNLGQYGAQELGNKERIVDGSENILETPKNIF